MTRKDLLKKAFRNNFIRKSVADLKSLGTEKAHPKPRHSSSTNLRSQYEEDAPVLPTPPMSTGDFSAHEDAIEQEHKVDASNLVAASETASSSRESVTEWLQTVPKDPAMMSSSEIRIEMEKVRIPLLSFREASKITRNRPTPITKPRFCAATSSCSATTVIWSWRPRK
ncbi:hypothetical protein P171DRAFT_282049 [Karstenula rhodostoma CBS 690.94]|uniref:Uncharacterized protein n=1 Tax=Karstenula rhodostoma CBS 690.94 TaxID=1392251 RepID=A0A9P4PKA6_9PLEO|nr:hypothetical protein P171DRAFT_282049 [Karstenula rhodostoma CBS 690.94]